MTEGCRWCTERVMYVSGEHELLVSNHKSSQPQKRLMISCYRWLQGQRLQRRTSHPLGGAGDTLMSMLSNLRWRRPRLYHVMHHVPANPRQVKSNRWARDFDLTKTEFWFKYRHVSEQSGVATVITCRISIFSIFHASGEKNNNHNNSQWECLARGNAKKTF